MGRAKNANVYRKGQLRFAGGDVRKMIVDVDEDELLNTILQARIDGCNYFRPITINKVINGVELEFTQKQSRSKLIHVNKKVE